MRHILASLFLSLTACASVDRSTYVDVTMEELLRRPSAYDGKHVRVSGGYLVVGPSGVDLSPGTDGLCGAGEYLTTTLPLSVLGAPPGQPLPYIRLMTVVEGVFDNSDRPGGDSRDVSPEVHWVGPLRRARVVSYGEQRCYYTREELDRARGER